MGFVTTLMFGDKKMMGKALKTAAEVTAQSLPIVKTISAGQGLVKAGEAVSKVKEVVDNLNDFLPKASKMTDQVDHFIPAMQVMGQSLCDSVKIFACFNNIATSVGIGANLILTYQGIQVLQLIAARLKDISTSLAAQTALIAQKDFPQYVYDMIRERLGQTSDDPFQDHWFFVYHPDNDWYPKFYHFLENQPLGPRFCGYTNQIDTVFIFMIAARRYIEEKQRRDQRRGRPTRPVKLHLLIPAYQPILIVEALKIPEEIGDFVMEGRINSNREFVWLNLPEDQKHYILDIGRWVPPTLGWWDRAMSKFGLVQTPPELREPRVLGTRQTCAELANKDNDCGDGGEYADDNDDDNSVVSRGLTAEDASGSLQPRGEDDKDRSHATPLHHRRRRQHGKRHRRNHGDDRENRP